MKEKVISILKQAKEQQWTYPKTYKLLKDMGVSFYTVSWNNEYKAVYTLLDGSSFNETSEEFTSIAYSNNISIDKAKQALKDHQDGKTNFYEWLQSMSNCGITNYTIDMKTNTATYYSNDKSQSFIENIPTI